MNRNYKHAALAAAILLAFGTASAQTTVRTVRADGFSESVSYREYLHGDDLRASKLVGARVRNADGDNLGEIEELVIPTRNDILVILSVGGVLDVGDKLVALPYEELRVSPDGDTLYINRTEEQLKAAPEYTYEAQAAVRTPAQRVSDERDVRGERELRDARNVRSERDVRDARDDVRDTRDDARETREARQVRDSAPAVTTAERPRSAAAVKSSNVVLDVFDYRASELVGATVIDDRGESVAKVDDIVVSTEDDKLHAVLAIGGFVGFGAKLISIPFDDLQITANGNDPQVRIAMTGEQLQELVAARPEFHYERQVAQAPATPRG
jgi:sporulation protein YlmC with PRC-barrel domain